MRPSILHLPHERIHSLQFWWSLNQTLVQLLKTPSQLLGGERQRERQRQRETERERERDFGAITTLFCAWAVSMSKMVDFQANIMGWHENRFIAIRSTYVYSHQPAPALRVECYCQLLAAPLSTHESCRPQLQAQHSVWDRARHACSPPWPHPAHTPCRLVPLSLPWPLCPLFWGGDTAYLVWSRNKNSDFIQTSRTGGVEWAFHYEKNVLFYSTPH